ncbi:MAG: TonB family protein [Bryobacterales bacterium]|nr:TonB family protein [Bryobacterales bacterium]
MANIVYPLLGGAALKSVLVLAAAWMAALALRRQSAAARHFVWSAAVAALLALPLLTLSLPALRIPPAGNYLRDGVVFRAVARSAPAGAPSTVTIPAATAAARDGGDWRPWAALIWGGGTGVALLQMTTAWLRMWRRRRVSRPFTGSERVAEVDVLEAGCGSMPMAFGVLRPAIFLPAEAVRWSEDRRRVVLLHELAHVERGDVVTRLLARVALAMYWWNPLMWVAWRESVKEQEKAADDLVLGAGTKASEYAGHLLEIARTARPAMGWAAIAMARPSQLEGRVRAILDGTLPRRPMRRASAWMGGALAVALVAPIAALQAQPEKMPPYEEAKKLLHSELRTTASRSGETSAEYGLVLLKLGALEHRAGHFEEADAAYGRAVSVLGERPQAAGALVQLGISAIGKKDLGGAFDQFERAERLDPAHAGLPVMWMGVARQREKKPEEAGALFERALSLVAPGSQEESLIGHVYLRFLREQGRPEEAASLETRIAGLQKANVRAAPERPSGVYRAGGAVKPPSLLKKVEPEYSPDARAAMLEGTTVLSVVIGTDGKARDGVVVRGLGLGLDEKALDAVSQWVFRPGTKDGTAAPVAAVIEVNWRLL